MQFDARLDRRRRNAGAGARDVLARLPATVHAFILVELQKWPTLFAPEQRYQRALLEHLSRLSKAELQQARRRDRRASRPRPASTRIAAAIPDGFRRTRRRCCENAGSCRRGGRKSMASSSISTPRSTHSFTRRMRPVDWSSSSMAAASASRQTSCGAASKGPAFGCR